MKKLFFVLVLSLYAFSGFSQGKSATDSMINVMDTTIKLDLLQAPASPAFNLLGISPSAIERPTDLNAFRLSIQNATNNFTKLPSNYSAEFSPASLFNIKNQTLTKFNSTDSRDVFWQSLSISLGFTRTNADDQETDDSTGSPKLGIGLKFSIIRPRWNDSTQRYIDSLYFYLDQQNKIMENINFGNARLAAIDSEIKKVNLSTLPIEQKIDSINKLNTQMQEVKRVLYSDSGRKASLGRDLAKIDSISLKNIKRLASGLKIVRKGVFLDFASGIVLDFPDNNFDNSRTHKAGAWFTGGYEGGENLSVLGIARYLFQPNKIFADDSAKLKTDDISTFDAGARIIVGGGKKRFAASLEGLYRSVLNKNTIPSSWRMVFNATYDIGQNRMITLSLGKNFDGTFVKSGNLIAALNLVMGFGSSKKLK